MSRPETPCPLPLPHKAHWRIDVGTVDNRVVGTGQTIWCDGERPVGRIDGKCE